MNSIQGYESYSPKYLINLTEKERTKLRTMHYKSIMKKLLLGEKNNV